MGYLSYPSDFTKSHIAWIKERESSASVLKKQLLDFSIIEFGSSSVFNTKVIASETSQSVPLDEITTSQAPRNDEIEYNTKPQPAFNKQFNLLQHIS